MAFRQDQVVPLLLETCPGCLARWDAHLARWGGQERGVFNDAAIVAHYVVDSYASGETDEFDGLFATIEEILLAGDDDARGVAAVGILETIQTIATHHAFGPEAFVPWLGPSSKSAWVKLDELWRAGGGSLAGVLRYQTQHVEKE